MSEQTRTDNPDNPDDGMFDALELQLAEAWAGQPRPNDSAPRPVAHARIDKGERELVEYRHRLGLKQRRAEAGTEATAATRVRKTADTIAALELRDELAAAQALAAARRAVSPTAQLADLHRYRVWAGRALGGVVAAGMAWSAVNVQHNIAGGAAISDPLYWFSYLIEAMISVCLIVVMAGAPRLAAHGVTVSRRTLTAAELALLALTVALNTYPHLAAGHLYDAAVHAVAPAMIAIALAIHHAMSVRVAAAMITAAPASVQVPTPAPAPDPAPAPAVHPAPAPPVHPAPAPPVHPAPAPAAAAPPPPAPTPVQPAAAPSAPTAPAPKTAPAPVRVHAPQSTRELAAALITRGVTKAPIDQVTAIIAAADADLAAGHARPRHTRIGKDAGVHAATAKRIITAVADLRAGAQVITLHTAIQP